jgi:hypothetical protein
MDIHSLQCTMACTESSQTVVFTSPRVTVSNGRCSLSPNAVIQPKQFPANSYINTTSSRRLSTPLKKFFSLYISKAVIRPVLLGVGYQSEGHDQILVIFRQLLFVETWRPLRREYGYAIGGSHCPFLALNAVISRGIGILIGM